MDPAHHLLLKVAEETLRLLWRSAAGDAFNGALAVALSEGTDFETAVRWGLAGGAVSVTRAGAQPSMPNRDELIAQMKVKA